MNYVTQVWEVSGSRPGCQCGYRSGTFSRDL